MDIKDLKIVPPEGMEYYIEGNEVKFRPKNEKLTYKNVAEKLFHKNPVCYITSDGDISLNANTGLPIGKCSDLNNCTSEMQAKKLLAINQLMNVAKYLNDGWEPNWEDNSEPKYYLHIYQNEICVEINWVCCCNMIYFRTRKLAQRAVEILGEETIKLALSTDW